MAFVSDASVAAAWLLPDEQSAEADALFDQIDAIHVPSLFWFEVRNLLLVAERRGRVEGGEALPYLLRLRKLPFEDAGIGSDIAILSLARRHNLTGYDAAYLALAIEDSLPLATLDRPLAAAARVAGVTVLGPLANG
jgi:predicted nucleic acid-binding protein